MSEEDNDQNLGLKKIALGTQVEQIKSKEQAVLEFMKHAPNGALSLICAESMMYANVFEKARLLNEGIVPRGETLEIIKKLLNSAPVSIKRDGSLDERIILPSAIDVLQRTEIEGGLFMPQIGSGIRVDNQVLRNFGREGYNLLDALFSMRPETLLLGLYAVGITSQPDRKSSGSRPHDLDVRYMHNTGNATSIRMNSQIASRLATIAENALIRARGTL